MLTVYSKDDENFNYKELRELFDEMTSDGALEVGTIYYKVEAKEAASSDFIDVNAVLEMFDEQVYDNIGECSNNDYSSCSDEARDELKSLLNEWSSKHISLNYWIIKGKSTEMTVTQEDTE